MFRYFSSFIVFISIFIAGCPTTVTEGDLRTAVNFKSFIPIDPIISHKVEKLDSTGAMVSVVWEQLSNDEKRKLLPNQTATMTTYKLDASGEAQYLTSTTTGKAGVYRVVMDYGVYRQDSLVDEDNVVLGQCRIGVGLRIKAEIETFEAGIDLGSLIALGFAAKANKIKGNLEVSVLGISSPEIISLFPTPSTIDETSIQKALEALAAIKAKIGDDATRITPQIIAIKIEKESNSLRVPGNPEKIQVTIE